MARVLVICALALVLTACSSDRETLPPDCGAKPADVVAALRRAPAAVTLPGGTAISRCVRDADSTAELETVGVSLHQAAEQLRDEGAALAVGYLAGAARKGADESPGIAEELAVRLERVAGRLMDASPRQRAEIQRGVRAGRRLG